MLFLNREQWARKSPGYDKRFSRLIGEVASSLYRHTNKQQALNPPYQRRWKLPPTVEDSLVGVIFEALSSCSTTKYTTGLESKRA